MIITAAFIPPGWLIVNTRYIIVVLIFHSDFRWLLVMPTFEPCVTSIDPTRTPDQMLLQYILVSFDIHLLNFLDSTLELSGISHFPISNRRQCLILIIVKVLLKHVYHRAGVIHFEAAESLLRFGTGVWFWFAKVLIGTCVKVLFEYGVFIVIFILIESILIIILLRV